MYLDRYVNRIVDCPTHTGRIYLSVFDINDNAITFSGAPYQLATYAKAAVSKFIYPAALATDRTLHYVGNIPSASIVLPENAYGEDYTAEWWVEFVSGTPNRDNDKLLATERYTWSGTRKVQAKLDINQESKLSELIRVAVFTGAKADSDYVPNSWGEYFDDIFDSLADATWNALTGSYVSGGTFGRMMSAIQAKTNLIPTEPASAKYESLSSVAYQSTSQLLSVSSWLEKDGALQTDTTESRYIMYDSAGTVVVDVTTPATIAGPLLDLGVFFFTKTSMVFSPDAVYFTTVIIKDTNGTPHVSANSPVTWD